MSRISALVITRNEAANIARCLRSVAWADERIVVDSGSTDDTVAIARGLGATVVEHAWEGYSAQKNFAQAQASGDWILSLDADERATQELRQEILTFISAAPESVAGARIPIRDWMFGKFVEHGSWPRQRHPRLYRRGRATWDGAVHEAISLDGEVGELGSPILHFSHLTIERFIAKLNVYTEIEARTMKATGQSVGLGRAALGAVRVFLGQYVRLQGYRDGGHGFILAVFMGFYHFVARAKLWMLWQPNENPDSSSAT